MAWHRPGDKPLFQPMMAKLTDSYMHHLASMGQQHKDKNILLQSNIRNYFFSIAIAAVGSPSDSLEM